MVLDQWIPVNQLEQVPNQETPLDLLKNRKFGMSNDLRRTINIGIYLRYETKT